MPRLPIALVFAGVVLALFPSTTSAVPATDPRPARVPPAPPAAQGSVVVAATNLYEGAVLPAPRDLADESDIRRFARRFAELNVAAPDVVALQEVRGSLPAVVRRLNRAMVGRATYAAVTRPGLTRDRGACAGARGRFTVVRDGALVINTATTEVLDRGVIRTWGRWLPGMRGVLRRPNAAGCAEHPWARVRVTREGATRDAVVVGTHVGPRGHYLKTLAMRLLGDRARELAGPAGLSVVAGDFNLPWCRGGAGAVESPSCPVADGHRELADRGFGDALRAAGVSFGTRGRVDFIHTTGQAAAAGWDRCYRPRIAAGCSRRDSAFASEQAFGACQRRAIDYGSSGGACRRRAYARYYSDHPIVRATIQ
ncbi:endonuclease/exonuclease/phosphatase family protein [Nocardioides sp. LHG3406-4]|uniref:endonuclease/exonuclease/phosphatase family protein n=1 Tax=Nocardioides sp. LHG3406-4 TaxID=2804575 RepID=UPI003CF49255